MERGTNEPVRLGFLDNFTSIHDGDSVGNALHHAQVVGNKQQGDAFFSLKVQQDQPVACLMSEKIASSSKHRSVQTLSRLCGMTTFYTGKLQDCSSWAAEDLPPGLMSLPSSARSNSPSVDG